MDRKKITEAIRTSSSQLKKQLLAVCFATKLLEEKGCPAPVVIGGCALAYYSREVYFTADIDRLNACKHWKSTVDCEMAELLL